MAAAAAAAAAALRRQARTQAAAAVGAAAEAAAAAVGRASGVRTVGGLVEAAKAMHLAKDLGTVSSGEILPLM